MTRRRDYEVGYGKPPKSTRFRKGQSGNPAGRRKGSFNLGTIVRRELGEEVTIRTGDGVKTVTKAEAIVKRMIADALQGDTKATRGSIELAERYMPETSEDDEGALTPDDHAIIERALAARAGKPGSGSRKRKARSRKKADD